MRFHTRVTVRMRHAFCPGLLMRFNPHVLTPKSSPFCRSDEAVWALVFRVRKAQNREALSSLGSLGSVFFNAFFASACRQVVQHRVVPVSEGRPPHRRGLPRPRDGRAVYTGQPQNSGVSHPPFFVHSSHVFVCGSDTGRGVRHRVTLDGVHMCPRGHPQPSHICISPRGWNTIHWSHTTHPAAFKLSAF